MVVLPIHGGAAGEKTEQVSPMCIGIGGCPLLFFLCVPPFVLPHEKTVYITMYGVICTVFLVLYTFA